MSVLQVSQEFKRRNWDENKTLLCNSMLRPSFGREISSAKMCLIAVGYVVFALLSQEKSGDSVREAAEGCAVHLGLLSAAPSRGAGGAWLPLNSGPGIFPHSRRRRSKQDYAIVSRWLPTSLSNHTCTFCHESRRLMSGDSAVGSDNGAHGDTAHASTQGQKQQAD